MADVFESKLTPRISQHLQGIHLESLSRIDASRLSVKAIPNIGNIELVSGPIFDKSYNHLYTSNFTPNSRERSELIVDRLIADFTLQRDGLAPFRVIGLKDNSGQAIGAAHFSLLHLPNCLYSVPYLQYIYVRPENRRQDMSEVLHTLVLGVATADATRVGRTVPFTFFETEPAGYGADLASQDFARQRAQVHTKTGSVALVLRQETDNEIITAHIQPGLEVSDPPITLVWAIRNSPIITQSYDISVIGKDLISAYYQSLRDEGFPEENIRLAETLMEERYHGRSFNLMPLEQVTTLHIPPLTMTFANQP